MKTTELKIKNLGLIANLEITFPNAGLVLVSGGNRQGKTTFIKGLKTMLNATTTDGMMTKGETIGYEEGVFKAANGEEYICRLDLDPKSKASRFTLLTPEGKKVKAISEVKDIFGYNDWTIEDFIDWGKNTEGARRQADIVLALFPEEVQKQIKDLSHDESEAYEKRTYLFRLKEDKQGAVKELKPDISDVQQADNIPLLEKDFDSVKEQLEAFNQVKDIEGQLSMERKNLEFANEKVDNYRKEYKACENEIERLKELIEEQKREQQAIMERANREKEQVKKHNFTIEELEGKVKAFDMKKKEELESRKRELEDEIAEAIHSRNVVDTYNSALQEWQDTDKKHKEIDERIKNIREAKRALMTSGLPIEGLYIEDDLLYIEHEGNLFRFNTNECSQSELMFKAVEIFMATNKGVRMTLISRGESFDKDMLKALHSMGVEKDYLYVMEYVSEGDIQVRGYEEVDNG